MFPSAEPIHVQLERRALEKVAATGGRASRLVRLFNFRLPRLKLGSRRAALKLQYQPKGQM